MNIQKYPALFNTDQIKKIENIKDAKWVCSTEHKGNSIEVFYAKDPHPVSNSKYFGLYRTVAVGQLMITSGEFIEDQNIEAVIADNLDVVYSRYRHDYVKSNDGSVWIDGGRSYTRCGSYSQEKRCTLVVRDGELLIQT